MLAGDLSPQAILNMSLAELANQEITSVSKKSEKASEAAAAIFVITQEDIKRSGATSIPEILRMAPGLDVAQAGAHDWSVSARGFNDQFANKLLVLIDGRTIYSPLFSGVIWQDQDTLLEDIDRIEVIRGPGATLWGANAVNGVINIITKSAKDTQGGLVTATAGNMDKAITGGRYGVKIGDDSYMRAYAKYNDTNEQYNLNGSNGGDGWQKQQAGFRTDSKLDDGDSLTVQGDTYKTSQGYRYTFPQITAPYASNVAQNVGTSGVNILSRWTKNISSQSSTTTQFYIDNTQYKSDSIAYNVTTADVDFQHMWTGWQGNEIIWGAGYRFTADHEGTTPLLNLVPAERNNNLLNAFLQDKITLIPDSLFLTLGSKFEHNDYTGIEVQPSARMSYLISDTQTLWGSVSRAVRTPSRFTSDGQLSLGVAPPNTTNPPIGIPTLIVSSATKGVDSEELVAYEVGYRIQPTKSVSLDIATFYNDYSRLLTSTFGTPTVMGGGAYLLQPLVTVNNGAASSLGYEITAKVDATQNWQLTGSYTYLDLKIDDNGGVGFSFVGKQPKNQFNIRSTYLFPYNVEMTNSLYYVDQLSSIDIPGYYRFDTKVSYEVLKGMEVSLVGQNLLDNRHSEFSSFFYQSPEQIGRSFYANVTVKF